MIQVIWHLDRIFRGPLSSALVDRWDRKKIMWMTNSVSREYRWNLVLDMDQYSIMPEVVRHDQLTYATGLFTSLTKVVYIIGSSLAGILVAAFGVYWAVGGILGGILAGYWVRFLGAGRLMMVGIGLTGLAIIGISMSTWLPSTVLFFCIRMAERLCTISLPESQFNVGF
ncbi:MFS transporter [Paenibacillus sp. SYP-B3998]|uniref:MFS transporter n=1 Tax=Paenibacillus sp. SYP-B3998 TaxID=2678564 RepID=A0A6G3ZVP9_9BACL|nr:MFS transporter [Paenibacillus sp. SYP-B3998]NEW05669.1 MFS transporter [Paenibacillus sp. SYP-B3998]